MNRSERLHIFLGTGFYSGFSKYFPGSVGTLVSIPFALFFNFFLHGWLYFILLIFFICYSSFLCWDVERLLNKKDAKEIVIDEWIGFFIATFGIPVNFVNYLIAFLLFRLFDIFKPFPIKSIDRKGGRGIGVVFDDVVAGIFALIILRLLLFSQIV